ncbi:MAG: hypothetical protein LAO30_15350 [Acidobacteriia bacterium]|nr:hypothetical protein [Terriglobia bacterium]
MRTHVGSKRVNGIKQIALLLIAVLSMNGSGFSLQTDPPSPASQLQTGEAKQAANARAEVKKRGVGEQSRVRVNLRDGTEVKGYISKVEENAFEVTDKKSGKVVVISYTEVEKVKGPGLSKAANIVIGVGVAVGVVVAVLIALTPST